MRGLLALIVQFASFGAMAQDTVHFPSFDAGGGNPATELTAQGYAVLTVDGFTPVTGEDPAARAEAIRRGQGFLAEHIALH